MRNIRRGARILAFALLLALNLLSAVSYGQRTTPKRGGTLIVAVPQGPVGLDPQKSAAGSTLAVTQLVYPSLLTYDENMNFIPYLAQSYRKVSETEFHFELRRNLRWEDGSSLTAEDVVYSLKRMLDPKTASPWRNIWEEALMTVEARDPYTVVVRTRGPYAPLLGYLASSWYSPIVSQKAVDRFGDLQQQMFGAGPFLLERYTPNSEVILKRNPYYFEQGLPYLDQVVFKIIPNEESQLAALRAGTIDIMWSADPLIEERVKGIKGVTLIVPKQYSATLAFWFNQTKPPFNNALVRRAISVAIDRKRIIDGVLRGKGAIATKIPPSSPYGYKGDGSDLPYYEYNPTLARRLLTEAGYARGFRTVAEIPAGFPEIRRTAEIMREQLAQIGVRLDIQVLEYGTALSRCIQTQQEGLCAIRHVWQPDPDAYIFPIYYSKSTINLGKFSDPEVDRLLFEGRRTTEPQKRREIYRQLERRVADRAYVIVPFAYDFVDVLRADVHGYRILPGGGTPGTRSLLPLRATWLAGR